MQFMMTKFNLLSSPEKLFATASYKIEVVKYKLKISNLFIAMKSNDGKCEKCANSAEKSSKIQI